MDDICLQVDGNLFMNNSLGLLISYWRPIWAYRNEALDGGQRLSINCPTN